MDFNQNLRLGDGQQIMIAFEIAAKVDEARAAIILFGQSEILNHRALGTVKQQDAFSTRNFKSCEALLLIVLVHATCAGV